MTYAKRIDANQPDIVQALRTMGASVQSLASVGKGCPDLLVGFLGANYAIEIKDESKPPSKRVLTPDQVVWHYGWRGQVAIVKSIDEAFEVCGLIVK